MTLNVIHSRNLVWDGTEWVPESQPGGGGGGAVTIADGADTAEGAKADAAATEDRMCEVCQQPLPIGAVRSHDGRWRCAQHKGNV